MPTRKKTTKKDGVKAKSSGRQLDAVVIPPKIKRWIVVTPDRAMLIRTLGETRWDSITRYKGIYKRNLRGLFEQGFRLAKVDITYSAV